MNRVSQPGKLSHSTILQTESAAHDRSRGRERRNGRGFTLVQILVVLTIMSMMAAMLVGSMDRARAAAQRGQCDARLKAIVLAWDAFRQEHRRAPESLKDLRDEKYLSADLMRCPADPRPEGAEEDEDYSIIRAPRDESDLPIVVCPFHEGKGDYGTQGFVGRYTTQSRTSPARLESANGTTVQRPGEPAPIAGTNGMELHGGDRIQTGGGGKAVIRFFDSPAGLGSTITLDSNTDVTVLQSFVMDKLAGSWFTIVRQRAGKAAYNIYNKDNHSNKFDVVTPTATAGARGTAFTVDLTKNPPEIKVTEGKVTISTPQKIVYSKDNPLTPVTRTPSGGLISGLLGLLGL